MIPAETPKTKLWQKGQSGNPAGRPKGTKNKLSLHKLDLELGLRERMTDKLPKIIDAILDDALAGDKEMRKLVWNAYISKATPSEEDQVKERISITIGKLDNSLPAVTGATFIQEKKEHPHGE